jgi:predicted MPP superfamily phosphohydrolase
MATEGAAENLNYRDTVRGVDMAERSDSAEGKFFQGKRIVGFVIVFEALSLLLHYYVFAHLFYLLDIPSNGYFFASVLLFSVLWLITMGWGMMSASRVSTVFHVASTFWLGLLIMFSFTLLGWDIVRQFVSVPREIAGPTVVAIAVGAVIFGLMNARFLRIKEVLIPTDKLEGEVKVAHLSDVHIGTFYSPRFLKRVVDRTNGLDPDIVVITGDLADGAHPYTGETFRALNDLRAPVYYVTGNHEHYAGLSDVLTALEETKVTRLINGMVEEKGIQVIGVDYWAERDEVANAIDENGPDPDKFSLVLYHVPRELDSIKERKVDLMLSGHTHGGQFFPFTFFSKMIWKKGKGLHDLGGTRLFVSHGIGTWGPPIRVGTSSQIPLIRIQGNGARTTS